MQWQISKGCFQLAPILYLAILDPARVKLARKTYKKFLKQLNSLEYDKLKWYENQKTIQSYAISLVVYLEFSNHFAIASWDVIKRVAFCKIKIEHIANSKIILADLHLQSIMYVYPMQGKIVTGDL